MSILTLVMWPILYMLRHQPLTWDASGHTLYITWHTYHNPHSKLSNTPNSHCFRYNYGQAALHICDEKWSYILTHTEHILPLLPWCIVLTLGVIGEALSCHCHQHVFSWITILQLTASFSIISLYEVVCQLWWQSWRDLDRAQAFVCVLSHIVWVMASSAGVPAPSWCLSINAILLYDPGQLSVIPAVTNPVCVL